MTLIYPSQGAGTAEDMLSEAQENFQRASRALSTLVRGLEDGDTALSGDAVKVLGNLRQALNTALAERERIESREKRDAGVVNDYAIDFDAARLEIGRRLACLRTAGGEGSVPE